jgi:phosphoglycerate dehydrogenase-like enzyme
VIVLVPDKEGIAALSRAEAVRPVLYDPAAPLPDEAAEAEALVVPMDFEERLAAAIRELPRLRLVQTLKAGVEAWQPHLPEWIALSNARGAHGGATAEWAAAALLAIVREFPRFAASQAAHAWLPGTTETLEGKRVLILGAGDLGTNLRRRLEPFCASVTMAARTARDGVHGMAEIPDLLGAHDAVVVMVPSNDETRHLVNLGFLARMPDDAILVNAARGPIVDTEALLAELRSGRLRAALDVTDPEPLPPDHPLWDAPGVLITPHVGGNTTGYADRMWAVAASQITAYAAGMRPSNLVVTDERR